MLDFNHVLSTPGYDFQQFIGVANPSGNQYQTWRKPRGVNFVYILAVGSGGSGGTGVNTGTTSGGGAGGFSGCQGTLLIPAMFLPDVLYIQSGPPTIGSTNSGIAAFAGNYTYVSIEPSNASANANLLYIPGANSGAAAATTTTGGTSAIPGTGPLISNMNLAGRGVYTFTNGVTGGTGGSSTTAGLDVTVPTNGLVVCPGAGGGGCNGATGFAGGAITQSTGSLGQDFFPAIPGGSAASGAVAASAGITGFIARNLLMNFGGTGGGGATTTAGGRAGAGGDGAPGCGGGGGGGMNTTNNTIAKGGNGGPGFVYIIAW